MSDRWTLARRDSRLFALCVAAVVAFWGLSGCQLINQILGNGGAGSGVQLFVSQTTNGKTTTYDSGTSPFSFGPVEPKSTPGSSVSFTVKNTSSKAVTISGISSDDPTDFTFTLSQSSIAAGASTTFTATFLPQSKGTKTATVTIDGSVGSTTGSVSFGVTGDGNYPPTVSFSVKVTSSPDASYEGEYVWDQSTWAYENSSAGKDIYLGANSALNDPVPKAWYIGPDTTVANEYADSVGATSQAAQGGYPGGLPATGTGAPWYDTQSIPATISIDVSDLQGGVYAQGQSYDAPIMAPVSSPALVLTVVYSQSDPDGDTSGTDKFQWQSSSSYNGTYTNVPSGGNSQTYTVPYSVGSSTSLAYYRVVVTPVSSTGVTTGTAVASPPALVIPVGAGG